MEDPPSRPPSVAHRFRDRFDTLRQSVSEVPVIEVNQPPIDEVQDEQGPDGGFGWVVLVSSFFCLSVLDGVAYTFGVFLDPLAREMKVKRSSISVSGSLLVSIYAFSGPLAAKLVTRFGTRKICMLGCLLAGIGLAGSSMINSLPAFIVVYSVLVGFGFGLMYVPSVVAVANHFTKLRSLAIGICLCGAGIGTFVLAPLESYLIDIYGRRVTFLVLSSFCFLAMVGAMTMRPVKFVPAQRIEEEDMIETVYLEEDENCFKKALYIVIDRSLCSAPEFRLFMLLVLADVLATFSLFIPYHHLSLISIAAGISKSKADFLLSVIGISSTVGRLAAGWFTDRNWIHPITIAAIAISCVPSSLFLFCAAGSYTIFAVLAAQFGFFTGVWISVMSPIFVRILGLPLFGRAFGLLTFLRGFASLAGPPLAAQAVDYFDDRMWALYLSGGVMGLSAAIFIVCTAWNRGRKMQRTYNQL